MSQKQLAPRPSKMQIAVDEYTAPDKQSQTSTSKSDRSKNFNALEAGKWGQKSIALEWTAMFNELADQKMDQDVAIASGASDVDAMTDSDAYAMFTPDLELYNDMSQQFNHVRSISEFKHEHNKAFSHKLNTLHEKIRCMISKTHDKLQHTQNNKLKQSYESACDFLADIQDEIASFEEDVVENETKLKTMDQANERFKSQSEKAMNKLKDVNTENIGLKNRIFQLSNERDQVMLDDSNGVIPKHKKKKRQKGVDVHQERLEQLHIDPEKYPYLYDDFEYDDNPACVAGLWHLFSKEIGFFLWNRNG